METRCLFPPYWCGGGVVCVWIHGTVSFTFREMESSTLQVPSSHYSLRPWVRTLGTNFLDGVTPTYITQESPQDQHVTSPWQPLMFISLSALVVMIQEELSSRHSHILSPVQQRRSFFTGETIEKDSRLCLEEQLTSYNHALVSYTKPHRPSVLLRPVKGFLFPIQSLFISLIRTVSHWNVPRKWIY